MMKQNNFVSVSQKQISLPALIIILVVISAVVVAAVFYLYPIEERVAEEPEIDHEKEQVMEDLMAKMQDIEEEEDTQAIVKDLEKVTPGDLQDKLLPYIYRSIGEVK